MIVEMVQEVMMVGVVAMMVEVVAMTVEVVKR